MDISGQVAPQGLKKPWSMLLVKVAHVVAESPFALVLVEIRSRPVGLI